MYDITYKNDLEINFTIFFENVASIITFAYQITPLRSQIIHILADD